MMLKRLFWVSLLLSLSAMSPKADAGSQGVFGGSEDASVLTGDTFNPADTIIVLEPLVKGLQYDVINKKLNFIDLSAWETAVKVAFNNSLPTTQGFMAENPPLNRTSAPVNEAISQIAKPNTAISYRETIETAGGSEDAIAISEQLAQDLKINPGTPQAGKLIDLLLTLQGVTKGDALQLNDAINAYNTFIDSLTPTAVVAFRQSQQGMDIRSVLVQLRNFSDSSKNNQ